MFKLFRRKSIIIETNLTTFYDEGRELYAAKLEKLGLSVYEESIDKAIDKLKKLTRLLIKKDEKYLNKLGFSKTYHTKYQEAWECKNEEKIEKITWMFYV